MFKKSGVTAGMGTAAGPGWQDPPMDTAVALSVAAGVEAACHALAVSRAALYRNRPLVGPFVLFVSLPLLVVRASPPRTLGCVERQPVLGVLHEERFLTRADLARLSAPAANRFL